jgi:hypothetical protein
MKITVIDCLTAGISGDMLLGALIDAGADPKAIQKILDLIPRHYAKCKSLRFESREVKTHGFRACGVFMDISEAPEETQAQTLLKAAEDIAAASGLGRKATSFAINSVKTIVDVESKLHGADISKTHLHEAGSADTLADVFGVAAACDFLGVFHGRVFSTPVAVGGGTTSFSHGTLSTPVPAVLEMLREHNVPLLGGPEPVETATPTGVSILVNLATDFVDVYPNMVVEIVGYGAGKLELKATPNVVRVVIGHEPIHGSGSDVIQVLETNLDDVPGEVLGHALQRVMESGAKDAWVSSAQFKKNRPGHVLHVICDPQDKERLAAVIMEETGTLGVRYQLWNRLTLEREVKSVAVKIGSKEFSVKVKFATDSSGRLVKVKPEFDDIRTIAKELSMPAREVADIVQRELRRKEERK